MSWKDFSACSLDRQNFSEVGGEAVSSTRAQNKPLGCAYPQPFQQLIPTLTDVLLEYIRPPIIPASVTDERGDVCFELAAGKEKNKTKVTDESSTMANRSEN